MPENPSWDQEQEYKRGSTIPTRSIGYQVECSTVEIQRRMIAPEFVLMIPQKDFLTFWPMLDSMFGWGIIEETGIL